MDKRREEVERPHDPYKHNFSWRLGALFTEILPTLFTRTTLLHKSLKLASTFSIARLVGAERALALKSVPAWAFEAAASPSSPEALTRRLEFRDFRAAFAFMTRVALHSEQQEHHPEWRNVYGAVEIRLTTHDAGGLSKRDVRLARAIDEAVAAQQSDLLR